MDRAFEMNAEIANEKSRPKIVTHLSLVHLIVGVGSPTELHGSRTSFIHGVVTVPPKDSILAGAKGVR